MKVKFANKIYEVLYSKEVAGKTVYAVEDEPNHVDWLVNVEVIDTEEEPEDEKVGKEIIKLVKFYYGSTLALKHTVSRDKMLAWLENQDFNYTFEIKEGHWYKCVCDYMLNNSDVMFKYGSLYYCRRNWRLDGEIDELNVKDIGVNGYKSFFRPATNQEIKDWLEKQGKQKSVWHDENEEPIKGSLILIITPSGTPVVAKVIEPNHTFDSGERWAYIDDLLKK